MKPLIYGYMHVELEQPDDETLGQERALKTYAEREGYSLVTIYRDIAGGSRSGFAALVDKLVETQTRHVVVPAMGQLGGSPALQYFKCAADGGVLEVHAVETNPVRPVAYGYMRVFCDVTDQQVYALEHDMRRFAQASGFRILTIFHEIDSGSHEAFYELGEAMRRADVRDVVVPSLRHLSTNRALRGVLLDCLEESFQADVHLLNAPQAQGDTNVTDRGSTNDGSGSCVSSSDKR